ncbi:protein NIM1-INTERACTING 2 [Sesamum indicum]|uniref:Protein NIM1-INTERACTING 2 n=1 Tax=Sesamum indicum TaxID=4182 RepID=A0A6I9T227_SESIN|nr:protein NIM1-INTERACTING 2 [Sesamum indicum]
MEKEKRKRQDDGEAAGKRGKPREENDGVNRPVPADEEVDEFFAILKRIQVAVKYFKRRNGHRCADRGLMTEPLWRPSFEREDFDGVKKEPASSEDDQYGGLDLNSDPASDSI